MPSTKTKTKPNVDMFVAALASIETYPEHHNQCTYRTCDSSYCFAGWGIQHAGFAWTKEPNCDDVVVPIEKLSEHWKNHKGVTLSADGKTAVMDVEYAGYAAFGLSTYSDALTSVGWLFSPSHSLENLYQAAAELLGITEKRLRRKVTHYRRVHKVRDFVAKPIITRRSNLPEPWDS